MPLSKKITLGLTISTLFVGFTALAATWSTCQPSRCSQTGVGGFQSWQECQKFVASMNRNLAPGEERWKNCVKSRD